MTPALRRGLLAALAVLAIALCVTMLERNRAGLVMTEMMVGTTPATLYRLPDSDGPVVVVAHGFAGSRQIMQGYSLPLAQAGYQVLAFDFEGHGRNPVPMSGDVTKVEGTTALLVAETRRVIAAARALPGAEKGIALLGHSMATDVIVRAANDEAAAGAPVTAVVSISMFSEAVTATAPPRLLVITGEWETRLRAAALDDMKMVQAEATENATVEAPGVIRRDVVAPGVEHVSVLFSRAAIGAARDWLDLAFGRTSTAPIPGPGPWILGLLVAIVVLFRPIVAWLPKGAAPLTEPATWRFLAAILVPGVLVPLILPHLYRQFLPVLVADYLMLHLAIYGVMQLAILRVWTLPRPALAPVALAILALVLSGIGIFGVALDRYAASFWPTGQRLVIILALAVGTVPFMVADGVVTGAGHSALWRRIAARVAILASLGVAAVQDPDRLIFLVLILPVVALFYVIYGLMGRWVARRAGALAAGVGLGLVLAWTIGVSFPLFNAG